MDISRAFAIDDDLSTNGAPIQLAPGVTVWVARLNNPKYAAALLKFYRQNRFSMERNLIDGNEADEGLCRILAETIFVRMEGLSHGGQPLEDTLEKRTWALLTFPILREKIVEESQSIANFQVAELAEEGKSSAPASDGS